MKKNVGRTDQIIRLVAGIVLLGVGILVPMSTWLESSWSSWVHYHSLPASSPSAHCTSS